MALLAFEGGVYTVVTVKDFCFWSFGGPFFSVPPGIPFGRAPFSGVLDIAACNSPGVAVVSSFMDPGGADTALIFGFTNVTVGPPALTRSSLPQLSGIALKSDVCSVCISVRDDITVSAIKL